LLAVEVVADLLQAVAVGAVPVVTLQGLRYL
jgi:hypothetical protein